MQSPVGRHRLQRVAWVGAQRLPRWRQPREVVGKISFPAGHCIPTSDSSFRRFFCDCRQRANFLCLKHRTNFLCLRHGCHCWLAQQCESPSGFLPYLPAHPVRVADGWSVLFSADGIAIRGCSCGFPIPRAFVCAASSAIEGNSLLKSQDKPRTAAPPGLKSPGHPVIFSLFSGTR